MQATFDFVTIPGITHRACALLRKGAAGIAAAALITTGTPPPAQAQSGGITTPQIMAQTVTALPGCLNYMVTGVCFFLMCELFYCEINTSIKVQHYMPDDVVSTFSGSDQNPWVDVGTVFSTLLSAPGDAIMGSITDGQADTAAQPPTRETIMAFKRATAIGNPIEAIVGGNMNFGFPDFSELQSFASSGLSNIGSQWAQVPSEMVSSTVGNVQSLMGQAQNMLGQTSNLPSQFGGSLSNLGSNLSSFPSSFKGFMSNLGNSSFDMSNYTNVLNNFGNMGQLGSNGMNAIDQLSNTQSLQDMMNQAAQSMGNSVGGANGQDYSNMDSSSALSSMNSMICPGGSGLFTINFDSDLDNLFWRGVIPLEQLYPGTWIPGIGEVGNGLINTWGGTYPRIGMLTQTDPVKASAVIAARVANIIEQAGQPHIYKKLSGQGSKVYFQVAQDPRWQMLYPVPSNGCITFGSNDSLTLTSFGDGKTSGNNGYVWNLWHRYECCQIEGAFLFAVP